MAEREGKTTRRVIVALLACALIYFMLRGQVIMTGQAKSSGGARPYSGNSPHSEPKDSNAGPLSAHIEQIIFDHHQVLSREYSFKWNKTKLQPRTATVSALQKEMSNMLGVTFDDDTAVTSVRFEYAFQKFAKTCGIPQKGITMRVRDYMQGDRAGYRTVDLKANASPASKDQAHTPEIEDSIEHIVRLPFDLAPQFKDHLVINKLEEDYHLCTSKYSREHRSLFPLSDPLETCADVDRRYPLLEVKKPSNLLERTQPSLWWVYKVEGHTTLHPEDGNPYPIKIESTFTLQYPNLSHEHIEPNSRLLMDPTNADLLVPSSKSEWSFRIFSPGEGHQSWRADLINHFDEKFRRVVDNFRLRDLLITDPKEHCD